MTAESIEQLKARLKREDEEQEEAFQKRLEQIRAEQRQRSLKEY
jgi:guanylate kinase